MKIEIINSIKKKDKMHNKIDMEMAVIIFVLIYLTVVMITSTGEFFKTIFVLMPLYVTGVYCCFTISWGKKKFIKLKDFLLYITEKKENIFINSERVNRNKILKEEKNAAKKTRKFKNTKQYIKRSKK